MICLFVCLSVCPELIEELTGATDLKFGTRVEHVVARNKTKDLSVISLISEKGDKMSNCVGFQLVLLLPTD